MKKILLLLLVTSMLLVACDPTVTVKVLDTNTKVEVKNPDGAYSTKDTVSMYYSTSSGRWRITNIGISKDYEDGINYHKGVIIK